MNIKKYLHNLFFSKEIEEYNKKIQDVCTDANERLFLVRQKNAEHNKEFEDLKITHNTLLGDYTRASLKCREYINKLNERDEHIKELNLVHSELVTKLNTKIYDIETCNENLTLSLENRNNDCENLKNAINEQFNTIELLSGIIATQNSLLNEHNINSIDESNTKFPLRVNEEPIIEKVVNTDSTNKFIIDI